LLLTVGLVSVLGAIFAQPITRLFLPGFQGDRLALAVHLVRIFFPMTGILALSAWSLGVLNSHRRFLLPYLAPVFWSLTQIFALVFGGRFAAGARLAMITGYGALAGAGLQLLVQLPSVRGLLGSVIPTFAQRTQEVRRAVRALGPVILGRGVVQLSALVDNSLASLLPVGAVAALTYAQNVYLLPVSLFGVGAAAAALPEMARQAQGVEGMEPLRAQIAESLTRLAFTTVPATLVFWVLPDQIVGAIYQTGRFDAGSTVLVSAILAVYGTTLLANAGVRVVANAFFALGDTATPARLAVVRVVVSIALSFVLMQRYGVMGLAAGSVIGGWLEAVLLVRRARRRFGRLGLPAGRWGKIFLAAILAAAAGYAVKAIFPWNDLVIFRDGGPWEGWQVLVKATASLGAFGLTYLVVAWGLGLPDVRSPLEAIGRRLSR
jgi:putative peptidoglycan lipid II flippase